MGKLQQLWEAQTDGRCCKWVHYFDIYERYINQYIDKPSKYLEIGVQQGGSLNLIKNYLGNQCETFGIDIDPSCMKSETEGHKIFIGSQEDPGFLLSCAEAGPFDIIVDDGGHTANQQLVSFVTLWPYLKDGGVYIVEDLHCSQFWPGYQGSALGINFFDFAKGLADKLSLWHMREEWFHHRYSEPLDRRPPGHIRHANFAVNEIFSIGFYDSLIAIEKKTITEPYQTRK